MALFPILRDFADWTAMPGLIQIINSLNAFIRTAWIVIWFALWGVFIYEFVLIIQQYFQFAPLVTLSLNYKDSRVFPMITICNQNPMNYTKVKQSSSYALINQLMDDYTDMVQSGYADLKNDEFGLNSQSSEFSKNEYTKETLILLMNQLSETKREAAGYAFDDFFLNYYWNNAPANRSLFSLFLDPFYGACYQFNAINMTDELQRSARSGVSFALRATALIHQYTPNGEGEYMPITKTAGLKIGINYPDEYPELGNYGIDVPAGTETFFAIKVIEIDRAKKPYGECVDSMSGSRNYYTAYNYTMPYCFASCIQNQYIANCSCAHPLYLKPDNATFCTYKAMDCVFNIRSNEEQGGGFDPMRDCDCQPSCSDTTYRVRASTGSFPADLFGPLGQPDEPLSPYACNNGNSLFNGSRAKCIEWFKDNGAVINIYFDGLDYQLMTEGAAYTLGQATNDLGGQMGLWTGISLVCVIEIAVFFIFIIAYFAFGRKLSDIEIRDDNREIDKRYQASGSCWQPISRFFCTLQWIRNFKEELDTQEIMDDEIKFRYREHQQRPERLRLERLDEGHRRNEEAAARAGIPPVRRRSSTITVDEDNGGD
ncbi:Degenerin-like protein asic-2 [Aphelenchoides fujianensis]|nr:Degenerin-like protein asic-2 [Aphelenchoides fujianensis]